MKTSSLIVSGILTASVISIGATTTEARTSSYTEQRYSSHSSSQTHHYQNQSWTRTNTSSSSQTRYRGQRNFRTTLKSEEEVQTPVVVSDGRGTAHFRVSRDGQSIEYDYRVRNLENINGAHLHLATKGNNGPVVVPLLAGNRVRGVIQASDLVGPLAGIPLSSLLTAMENDQIYLNVHTLQYPDGEVRGQVK